MADAVTVCVACDGDGRCAECNGTGYLDETKDEFCPFCFGGAECPECNGGGKAFDSADDALVDHCIF